MNRFKTLIQYSKALFFCGLGLLCVMPSVYITRFSYPAQDDFYYGQTALELMEEGYGHVSLATHMVRLWHQTWGGLYSSTFLGFFFSGYTYCDVHRIRIFEFLSATTYVLILLLFSAALSIKVFKLNYREVGTVYGFLLMFLFGVVYYGDFDVFYWFITSVQYLLLMSSMLMGVSVYILAIHTGRSVKRSLLIILSILLGFITSGANLALAGLNVISYICVCIYYWLVSAKKKEIVLLGVPIVPIIGALINGTAPGNYVRAGGGKSFGDIIVAFKSSNRFVFERIEEYVDKPEFWIVLLGMILATMFINRENIDLGFNIKYPILISFVSFFICVFTVFPAMLGYEYEAYTLLIRGHVILDLVSFVLLIINVLLYEQWAWKKYGKISIQHIKKDFVIGISVILCLLAVRERDNNWRWIGVCRNYRDLDADRFEKYADYYIDILHQVERSEEKLVILYVDEVEEKTSQINPIIVYDTCYDPEGYGPNDAIADFYDKEGVWVLHRDYIPSEDDILMAKQYGIDEWPDSE